MPPTMNKTKQSDDLYLKQDVYERHGWNRPVHEGETTSVYRKIKHVKIKLCFKEFYEV